MRRTDVTCPRAGPTFDCMNSTALSLLSEPQSHAADATDPSRYRWSESAAAALHVRSVRRASSSQLFSHTLVPQLERRGAAGLVYPATGLGDASPDARWILWRAPGNRHPMWGLYACAERLTDGGAPAANDAWVLIAWGEGPVLAWMHDGREARSLFRGAMSDPPGWFANGMRSGDPTFPVQLDRLDGAVDPVHPLPACAAVVPPSVAPGPLAHARDIVLVLAQAWRLAMLGVVEGA